MKGHEIREKFLQYFADRGHQVVESSSLVPQDDPTLLFVNSGMVQFKRVFTGEETRPYTTATSCQRSVRAGGKHNDLENVGYTARHHTFFEMLGNFSFGDYFKKEAIGYAWDFLTEVLAVPKEHLWVSVFDDDDEAFALWEKVEGLLEGRIVRMGESENFWAMGDTGPCGPCSEIHFDQGVEAGCGKPGCKLGCDCDRFLELWNLVFMQFERDQDGTMTPLPKPSIDTGMGLERVASVLQGKYTNYDSEIFTTIMDQIGAVSGTKYGADSKSDTALKVIADHARATTFLVADGVLPSNEGRGYVLRRIMRRAIRYGRSLGMTKPFLVSVTAAVVEQMKGAYPHLHGAAQLLAKVVNNEEERFLETLDNGLSILGAELARMRDKGETLVAGDFIFKLYDTFGFPVDIVRDMALEVGFSIDQEGFKQAMDTQRQQSKKSWKGGELPGASNALRQALADVSKTEFIGYETRRCSSTITAMVTEHGERITSAALGQHVMVSCPQTPFYAESGGQTGDHGEIIAEKGRATVVGTSKTAEGVFLHKCEIDEGELSQGDSVEMRVAEGRRQRIAANHSATHLLQSALQEALGDHIKQSGSLVEEERLRFDFTHFSPLTEKEIFEIESLVNSEIRTNVTNCVEHMDKEKAKASGARALFGEKYDDVVRVVSFGQKSSELCGGTHVGATGEIGLFKIVSETGIAAGVRRIVGVTGEKALQRVQGFESTLTTIAHELKTSPEDVVKKVKSSLARQKDLEKEVGQLTAQLSLSSLDSFIDNAKEIGGVKVVTAKIQLDSPKTLREIGDKIRDKLGSGVVVIGGELDGKVSLLAVVTKDLCNRCHAGKIIKAVAGIVGGSGGGRPDMAQAGGSMPDKLTEALEAVNQIIENQMT